MDGWRGLEIFGGASCKWEDPYVIGVQIGVESWWMFQTQPCASIETALLINSA